ncbi:MAG: hypothetical protein WBP29_13990 [Candidatus Zixiibacteriota bacterium]
MKTTLTYSAIIISFLAIFAKDITAQESAAVNASIEIKLSGSSFMVGEDIWLEVSVRNTGTRSTALNEPLLVGGNVHCVVTDSRGGVFANPDWVDALPMNSELAPGMEVKRLSPLLNHVGTSLRGQTFFAHLPPEQYSLYCEFQLPDFSKIRSETIRFSVERPAGNLKDVWSRLVAIDRRPHTGNARAEKLSQFKDFVRAYSASPWTPAILSVICVMDKEGSVEYVRELLNKFPDSPHCDFALVDLARLTTRSEFDLEISALKSSSGTTRLGNLLRSLAGETVEDLTLTAPVSELIKVAQTKGSAEN